jgi:hypothetical protein
VLAERDAQLLAERDAEEEAAGAGLGHGMRGEGTVGANGGTTQHAPFRRAGGRSATMAARTRYASCG